MAAAARQAPWLVAWGHRLRRGLAAGRRGVPNRGTLAAAVAGMALAGAGAAWHHGRASVAAREGSLSALAQKSDCEAIEKVSLRKQRFMQFSSLEHEGEYYMTPRDFLFSVMFDQMERKTLLKKLFHRNTVTGLDQSVSVSNGKGLISYTEYLFLLTILTKPHTGFHVAFKMLDADGNERIEKKEFVKLQKIISKQDDFKTMKTNETECQEPTVKEPEMNTTLQMRFFGKRGERKLHYKEFRRSISLDEFKSFCHFTTHLEDFAIAMQMFSLAHRPVRMAEFKRAVKVATGQELSNNILDTVFKIFDLDGDECLSHGEFLGVLKNRMHRGLWVPQQQSVQEYWKCVKKESIKGVKEVWKQAGRGLF
ncbi:PREDICTED: calcium uptake protein 2, mitochondrial [Dipodomys ordii]|uniref:Calcium uptake protein 2, mitochondrial n=1 Tax=Dipodomys ordii TaxID=10020 RepID=A0A1S3EXS4_DIPOR|nr:PREDICTED: calcium uptake protein 2, mitochondrial [Dipodomys ordii]